MKRDWDVIREVLLEIEAMPEDKRQQFVYATAEADGVRARQAMLLWKAGFIQAIDASTYSGDAIISPDLTWQGHDLLDTIRSKPIWDKIKSTAIEKSIDLSFDAVMRLGKIALEAVLG